MNEPTVKTETDDERRDRGRPSRSNRPWRPGRRDMIRLAGASMGAGMVGGFHAAALDAAADQPVRRPNRRLRAAFSNIGLQVTWCAQGKQAAEFWGRLFDVEVTWFDGGLSTTQQRAALDEMASRDWDFVAIQAGEIDALAAPVNRMIDAGIPVIDMDTLIAPLDRIAVHTFLAPDNEFMGAAVTKALVDAIGGAGTIIMTQGALGHTGAQGRARGFESVIAQHPNIEVLATDPADWDPATVVRLWESVPRQVSAHQRRVLPQRRHGTGRAGGHEGAKSHGDSGRRCRRHASRDPGRAGWPNVRDRAQLLVPHSWRRDRGGRGRGTRAEEDSGSTAKTDRHRRTNRHAGKCARSVVDGGSLSDLTRIAL